MFSCGRSMCTAAINYNYSQNTITLRTGAEAFTWGARYFINGCLIRVILFLSSVFGLHQHLQYISFCTTSTSATQERLHDINVCTSDQLLQHSNVCTTSTSAAQQRLQRINFCTRATSATVSATSAALQFCSTPTLQPYCRLLQHWFCRHCNSAAHQLLQGCQPEDKLAKLPGSCFLLSWVVRAILLSYIGILIS